MPPGISQPVGGGPEFLVAVDQAVNKQMFDNNIFYAGRSAIQRMQPIGFAAVNVAVHFEGLPVGDGG